MKPSPSKGAKSTDPGRRFVTNHRACHIPVSKAVSNVANGSLLTVESHAKVAKAIWAGARSTQLTAEITGIARRTCQVVFQRLVHAGLLKFDESFSQGGRKRDWRLVDRRRWEAVVLPACERLVGCEMAGVKSRK